MCGIAGEFQFNKKNISLLNLEKALLKQFNRGPDDGQIYLTKGMALGHRRLKIFDLSHRGMQPMVDSDLGLALVFNGAIYNFVALREELKSKGYSFISNSDTEVLLKAYHAWGKDCVHRFSGMFAFAIWEQDTGKLILARDRLGIKPLYYSADANYGFKFASTLPALIEFSDIDTSIDKVALHYYLTFHAVPEPLTILSGVKKLPPGSIMTIHPEGKIEEEVYWDLNFDNTKTDHYRNEHYWIKETYEVLKSVTQRQLAADVPVGILLSGGLDSSLLVAMASKLGHEEMQTFSIGFDGLNGEQGDEFFYSNLIASKFNTQHQQMFISNKQLAYSLGNCISAMSEPMLSHDNIGFYLLSHEVSKHVKVVLSGQGADEIFAGYHWFQNIHVNQALPSQSAQIIFNKVADRSFKEYQQLVMPDFQTTFHASDYLIKLCERNNSKNPIDNLLKYESTFALANGPLSRVDNMTMAASLEARVPFLDEKMLQLATSMPLQYKLPQRGKYILKQLGRKMLPKPIVDRPKGYFPVPALKYLEGSTLELMREVLSPENIKQRGIFNLQAVQNLFTNSAKNFTPSGISKLWQIGLLEYWLQQHNL
ncbi:N-acetylglutaminylglutamine amidotransferase [Legionella resiliens]|uniref:asparagine synthase (glutamine-hydrolyzing) n=1 Tax=Legionella resiliens TaxID=2905958 RepID=A0ABS8X280_9GAMM|nr:MULTISPECIES: N-acetylglutaminylglutamine amidotransferase [unclassified Legionella]MCE0722584.1 N-acetylglutaminylglutamine amidotransferase [Legionella sp. 9fVS26]MCE3531737.1 N-acetylglutaminylglutamine amidotransferase [Legionella sp. 8cVS16]